MWLRVTRGAPWLCPERVLCPAPPPTPQWAVARPDGGGFVPYVLVGDLNRCVSQQRRGGGGLLLAEPTLHRAFLELVKETD